MHLFSEKIENWDDWYKLRESIPVFTPLVEHIFQKEDLPLDKIENLAPGMNAVFKTGEYVIKIFALMNWDGRESSDSCGIDADVEIFSLRLAEERGVPAPRLIAEGVADDKYRFRYIVMDYIRGTALEDISDDLTYEQKVAVGRNIRNIADKLNVSICGNFAPVDVLEYAKRNGGWLEEGFPESFEAERQAYLSDFHINERDKVYCHGDIHSGNILADDALNLSIIDFASAMYAPVEYELTYAVCLMCNFEKPYVEGYLGGGYSIDDIVDMCMTWLPVHAWGHDVILWLLESVEDIASFAVLREQLYSLVQKEFLD